MKQQKCEINESSSGRPWKTKYQKRARQKRTYCHTRKIFVIANLNSVLQFQLRSIYGAFENNLECPRHYKYKCSPTNLQKFVHLRNGSAPMRTRRRQSVVLYEITPLFNISSLNHDNHEEHSTNDVLHNRCYRVQDDWQVPPNNVVKVCCSIFGASCTL